jgi:hypothetical protein
MPPVIRRKLPENRRANACGKAAKPEELAKITPAGITTQLLSTSRPDISTLYKLTVCAPNLSVRKCLHSMYVIQQGISWKSEQPKPSAPEFLMLRNSACVAMPVPLCCRDRWRSVPRPHDGPPRCCRSATLSQRRLGIVADPDRLGHARGPGHPAARRARDSCACPSAWVKSGPRREVQWQLFRYCSGSATVSNEIACCLFM